MRLIAINAKKSLAQLAVLRGIPLTKGWVKQLAGWLGVEPNSVSTWSRRTPGIPEKRIKKIEDLGYPREKWYIEEEIREEFTLSDEITVEVKRRDNSNMTAEELALGTNKGKVRMMPVLSNKTKKSLIRLAKLMGIEDSSSWETSLAASIEVSKETVYAWIKRDRIANKSGFANIEARGYPREKWYIEEKITEEFTLGDDVTVEIKRGGNIIEPEDDDFMDCSFLQNYSSYHAAFILLRDENIHTADVVMIDYLKKKYGEKLDPQYGVEMKEEKRA